MALATQHRDERGRHSAMATLKGYDIEIVTGYSIERDRYLVHVYLTKDGKRSHHPVNEAFHNQEDAEARGLAIAEQFANEGR